MIEMSEQQLLVLMCCAIIVIVGAVSLFTENAKKKKYENNVHFYVARDKNGGLCLYIGKPIRGNTIFYSDISNGVFALTCCSFSKFGLNEKDYDNLKWEDEPVEVFLNMED